LSQIIIPVYTAFSKQYAALKYYNVDVDEGDEIAEDVDVRMLPTFVLYRKGEQIGCLAGAKPTELQASPH
jgi:thioredoxin 1